MKNKIIKIIAGILIIISLMFAEYRFIMHNINPYTDDNGTLYLEVFGMVDTYYTEFGVG